jgi:hypothetical protein
VGIESVGSTDAQHPVAATAAFGVAGVGLTAAALYLLRTPRPLLDLRILRIETYRVTAFGGSIFRAVISAIPLPAPGVPSSSVCWSATKAGLVVISLFLGNIAVKPLTTPLTRRFGIRPALLAAIVTSAACLVGIALLEEGPHPPAAARRPPRAQRDRPLHRVLRLHQRRLRRRRARAHDEGP